MTAADVRPPIGASTGSSSRRRRGLVMGAAGLALVFGPATLLLFAPATFAFLLVGTMVVGVVLLIAAFIALPRKS